MTSSFYSAVLGKKVLYKKPLFIASLELKNSSKPNKTATQFEHKKKGGANLYEQLTNKLHKLRFIHAIHETFSNAVLILRHIFLTKELDQITKYTADLNTADETDILNILTSGERVHIYEFKTNNLQEEIADITYNKVIIKLHDRQRDNTEFLDLWKDIMLVFDINIYYYTMEEVVEQMAKQNFKDKKIHLPNTTNELNPLIYSYIYFERS